ncbi:hypothetical protein H1Q63_30515, partial [Desmonostoc muscorum CCALA 125]|nr:hypothetical protein [Desmonostoc muscorum CCALA 125]
MFNGNESDLGTEIANNLEVSLQSAYGNLIAASKNDDFLPKMAGIFGGTRDLSRLQALSSSWGMGDFSQLPTIQVLLNNSMNGANGAFSEVTRTIYLSSNYLSQGSSNPDTLTGSITGVLLEEIGHFVDTLINPGSDTAGDEGELFAATVMGLPLSNAEKLLINSEDDRGFITIDGKAIAVEQSNSLSQAPNLRANATIAETPVITIAATDASAAETATGITPNPGTFTLTRTGNLATALTVNYSLSGTATKGTDYSNLTGTVSFAAGANTATIKVTPTDDTLAENSETAILTLKTGTGYTLGTTTTAIVTIADNETPVITIAATDANAAETATGITPNPGTFTLTRTGNLATALTVNYSLSGTATKGTDYSNLTGTVNFAAGANTATIKVTPTDDTLAENSETAILTLKTGTGYTLGTTTTAIVTIADNETPVISVAATDASAAETATGITPNPGTFTLTRTGNLATALTVNYSLSGTATKGTDYSNLTGTVSFAAGANTATVKVTPTDDTLYEETESVILTLASGTNYTLGTANKATISILDNDPKPNNFKQIIEGLSLVKTVFTALTNTITQNPLLTQKISLLSKRIDSNTASVFLNDVNDRINKALINLTNTANLDLKAIVDQLSKSIGNLGILTVSIDGKLIPSNLINTINLDPNQEIVFNFDFSKLFTISETLAGKQNFEIAGYQIETTINGKGDGASALDFKFSIGIDKLGKVFVNEGGFLSSALDLNTTLAGSASIKGLLNAGINGTGTLNLDAELKLDDGDTTPNERLYLTGGTPVTLFSPKAVSFTGGIVLDRAIIKGSIPALSQLELAIAASGSLDFVTGKAKLVVQQDALLDTLVNAAEKGIEALANQSTKIAKITQNLPVIGDELSTAIASTIKKGLGFNAPDKETKAYLKSLGITVEKLITPEQFFSGNFLTNDLLLLRYSRSVNDTLQLLNASGKLDLGLADFTLNGNLQAKPNLALDVRFGLDLVNGPFMLEGAVIDAQLPITGNFNGSANIGKLLQSNVNISNATFNPKAKLTFSDFDNVANERFYLLGSNQFSLDTVLGKKDAIALTGNLDLLASLTISNPLENLDIPLINKIIPNNFNFTWNAAVQYDIATGTGKYEVKNDAKLGAILGLFQGNQQGIIDLFLGDLIKSNPIPKDVRNILNLKIPLLDQNLLDIIGVPKAAQILINPEQFKGKSVKEINRDGISLNLDFLSANSIINLLGGNDANLVSLDIQQSFTPVNKTIPAFPVTPVFSFFGILNVTANADIKVKASLKIDTALGIDTQGFYVVESGKKATSSSRTVGDTLFSLNPELSAILTGTLLVTALPIIDVSGKVSLIGEVGIRLDDSPFNPKPDLDPKVRFSEVINPDNLHLKFGLDLGFGLTSTLVPVGNFGIPLIKDGEVEKIVELYNREAGSLTDIKKDVTTFFDKTKKEGALYLYALGLITGDPILITAANALAARDVVLAADKAFNALADGFKENGADILDAAHYFGELAKEYGLNLAQTAKFLYEKFSDGVADVANALYKEVTHNIGDIAKGLYKGVTQDLGSIAEGLYNGVTKNIGSVAKGLYDGVTTNLGSIARGLYNGVTTNLDSIAKGLYEGVTQDLNKIAKAIIDEFGIGFSLKLGNVITEFLLDGTINVWNYTGDRLDQATEWFTNGTHKVTQWLTNGTINVWNYTGDRLDQATEWFTNGTHKVTQWLTNGTINVWNYTVGKEYKSREWPYHETHKGT